jgi:hypothetical protein
MKLLYISLILCFFSSVIYAQSNYHEGYVLKNNGDTVKGYINYHEWTQSPKVIDFKTAITDKKAIQFHPVDIKAFSITGMEAFVSYTGYISTNKTIFRDYPQQLDTSKVLDTIFLQQTATGKNVTLYYNSDEIKTRFFMAETNAEPVELKYYVYYNSYNQVTTSPVYMGQLTLYTNKFAPGNSKLLYNMSRMEYDQRHLEAFTNSLNNVNGDNNVNSRFFVGAAVSSTSTRYNLYNGVTNYNKTTNSISPKINFGIDMFSNPNVQQLIFRAEVSLWYAMPRFNSPGTINNAPTTAVYEFNQYNATITPQILLNVYNKDNFKFYIDGGWAFNFSSYSNNQTTVKNEDAATTAAYTVQKPIDLEGFWSNFPIQVGIVLNKRIEIYAGYAFYSTYTKYLELSVANQTTNVGIKFLLK